MPRSKSQKLQTVESRDHYTYQVKLLIDVYNAGLLPEVRQIVVEPRYGYVATIIYHSGSCRVVYGHDPGFNPGSSEKLAKDKGYTKFFLREMGIDCAPGEEFLLPWWADILRHSNRQEANDRIISTDEADAYIRATTGYPIFVKPANGSQGYGAQKVYDVSELTSLMQHYNNERVKVALVEKVIELPDYRLLVIGGRLVNAYERQPLTVVGDGISTLRTLVEQRTQQYRVMGRSVHLAQYMPQVMRYLSRKGLTLDTVPVAGEQVQLLDISNLSAGGTPLDVAPHLHPRWVELACTIAKGFNLEICGIDLACADITAGDAEYYVIEVNATPGVEQFMASKAGGREELRNLFVRLFQIDQPSKGR